MEKKGVYFARKFILAVGVFFLLLILPAVNAEAKEVSLVKRGCDQVYGIFDPLLLRGW